LSRIGSADAFDRRQVNPFGDRQLKRTINLDKLEDVDLTTIEECIGKCIRECRKRYRSIQDDASETTNANRERYGKERAEFFARLFTEFSNRPEFQKWQH
jgi:hypothetical protein